MKINSSQTELSGGSLIIMRIYLLRTILMIFQKGNTPFILHFFFGVDLTLCFDPLLVEFFRDTRFHIWQLTQNAIRIILGTAELNIQFNMSVGLMELKYCYCLAIFDEKWNLRARPHFPSLVERLSSSHKEYYKNVITRTSAVKRDPVNKPPLDIQKRISWIL